MFFASIKMFSSEQECRDLLGQLIQKSVQNEFSDLKFSRENGQDLNKLKILLSQYPQIASQLFFSFDYKQIAFPLNIEAACGSSLDLMKILLEAGANPNHSYDHFNSPTFEAASRLFCLIRPNRSTSEPKKNLVSCINFAERRLKLLMKFEGDVHQTGVLRWRPRDPTSAYRMIPNVIEKIQTQLIEEKSEHLAVAALSKEAGWQIKLASDIVQMLGLEFLWDEDVKLNRYIKDVQNDQLKDLLSKVCKYYG